MSRFVRVVTLATLVVAASSPGAVYGGGTGTSGFRGPGGRGGPPPEAVEACRNRSEGDAVEFTSPRGDLIKATCRVIGGLLAAVPADRPAPPVDDPADRDSGGAPQ